MAELGNLQELSNLTFRNTQWGSTTKGLQDSRNALPWFSDIKKRFDFWMFLGTAELSEWHSCPFGSLQGCSTAHSVPVTTSDPAHLKNYQTYHRILEWLGGKGP